MLRRHFLTVACFFIFSHAYTFKLISSQGFEYFFSSSRDYLDNNVHLATVYLDSALALAIANDSRDQLGICSNQRGLISLRRGELDSAEHYYLEALDYFNGSADSLKVRPLKNLGVLAYFKGDMETAIGRHLDALEYYLEAEDATEIARTYSNLGVFYKNSGQFIAASKSYIQSLEYFEIIKDQVGLANTYNNIGSIYVELERHNEAMEYFQRAIAQSEGGSAEDMAIWHHNMALSLRELDMLDSAQYYQSISLDMRIQLGDSSGIAQSYHELGLQSMARQDYPAAKEHLERAFSIAKRMGDVKYQVVTLNNLAELELGAGQPEKALQLLAQYDAINAPIQIQSEVVRQRHLATAYHRLGVDELALQHLRRFEVISDSLKNVNLNRQLDEINAYYESQQKEQIIKEQALAIELASAKHQSDLRDMILLIGLVIIIGVIITVRLWYQNIDKKKLLLKGQVDIARNQMSPEFLYESLDVVSKLLDDDRVKAEQAVYKLSNLYQKMVENFNEDLIPLEEELDLLRAYMDLMTMSEKIQFDYTCKIQHIEKYAVVPFSFLMLFENAIVSQEIAASQSIKLYDNENSFVVENLSTGKVVGAVPQSKASFPFIDQKYKVVCGRGISFEQLDYRRLVKIPKIEWQYA